MEIPYLALGIRIDRELKERLDAYAAADDRTLRSVVQAALREYLYTSRARELLGEEEE